MSRLLVLAGPNGSGKSSVAGALLRENGGDYFNPDEVARAIADLDPAVDMVEANSRAWHEGVRRLEAAIARAEEFNFETTLGGKTITRLLQTAIAHGVDVVVWYVALATPELHVARVQARVAEGGHDIPEGEIRRRFDSSRLNLIELMPGLAALRVFDNSAHADLARGEAPAPQLLLHMERGAIVHICDLAAAAQWAKPILAAALAIDV
jgi:predicted ABC-type ATPase